MANEKKKFYPCNLLRLREEKNLTQKELGEILGVSERMVCNYEISHTMLPLDKAIFLCQKYNLTLEWMYCLPSMAPDVSALLENNEEYPKFIVDIRDFLSYSNDSVFLTIPNYYWEYMKERNAIMRSRITDGDKKRRIAELNGEYRIRQNEQKYWRISIKAKDFLSTLRFDSEFIPFDDSSHIKLEEPSEEEIEEAAMFLKTLSDMEEDI